MTMTLTMTADAKRALSTTIRGLRSRLLDDLHAATETAYRLSVRARDAGLDEAARRQRARLEAWIAEQRRAQGKDSARSNRTDEEFRREAEKEAAYTLLNRLVILRLMEAPGSEGAPLRAPAVVTGGWESRAYMDFRQLAPALVRGDATEGYAFLLQLVFEDLAGELPGLYGPVGVADLIPIPTATLRHVVEELDRPELATCWTDDMTLGWVYQYWNDPAREALDAKLNSGGKLEPHEIASKTQMFTERYMVDWLLQNSLGPMWLAMCQKHGWTPEVEADGTLQRLEERRVEWRARRESGEVSLTDLMPLHTDAERRWAYYVPQPIPADAVAHAPDSVRTLKLLDPAVGSGHFLVVALYLLVALYREEARHRGEADQPQWRDRAIVERILAHNLHGIDLDPRAVQIAAAALWIKGRQIAPDAQPERLNLVASNLRLASLPDDDPALVELRREVERETGIPAKLTDTLVQALRGADHLGSLLKVNRAVEQALAEVEGELGRQPISQGNLFAGFPATQRTPMGREQARTTLLDRLEAFLTRHTRGDDLGLRLRGEQLAAGVRFVRMVQESTYDLVVANPPYQGTGKMAESGYIEKQYPLGKADLFAVFLLRGLELVRKGGVSSMLTMRNWMFIKQYADLRKHLMEENRLCILGDLDWGSFREMKDVKVLISSFQALPPDETKALAIAPTGTQPSGRTQEDFEAKNAGFLLGVERHEFDPAALKVVPEWPLVYWWDMEMLEAYSTFPLLGSMADVRSGMQTGDNTRFVRRPHEVKRSRIYIQSHCMPPIYDEQIYSDWVPYIQGSQGRQWLEPCASVLRWRPKNLPVHVLSEVRIGATVRNEAYFFEPGVAFTPIGASLTARSHRFASVCDTMGASIFCSEPNEVLALLNSTWANRVVSSLNPTVHFQVGDLVRIPFKSFALAKNLVLILESAFTDHESHREPSIEFKRTGPSPWRYAQEWAQTAVDRPDGAPLPPYEPVYDPEPPTEHLSFALGVALGRFGPNGEGILDPAKDDLAHALLAGILFLDGTLDEGDHRDSLGHPAAAPLHTAWARYGPAIKTRRNLRGWLALDFFKDVHKGMYENRPIHWPLTSANRTFVAWVNIHRFTERTLRILLADHLHPALNRLEGELTDLRAARDSSDKGAARAAEKRYDTVLKARDELADFIAAVAQCDDRGAPPTDARCPAREQNARYAPDLDDGVMINSAALWPLLDPQWKDPKKWWKELATAQGRKDYDWSHLAMRYWPTRVDEKCQTDPSLGVAHGCFWRYHPQRAWAWELRLQDEIGPDFRIQEPPYCPGGRDLGDLGDGPHRDAWLQDHAEEALTAVEKEALRRMGRSKKRTAVPMMTILEPGLWSALPAAVWAMELRLAEKQGLEFILQAPDEAEARAAFGAAHPQMVAARVDFLASLVPQVNFFDEEDEDEEEESEAPDEESEDADE
jgi:hypothetical protein